MAQHALQRRDCNSSRHRLPELGVCLKRTCIKCGKNRPLADKAGRAVFSPQGRICSYCQKITAQANSKNQRLQGTYVMPSGQPMTLEDYQRMYDEQTGHCAICSGWRKVLCVDHCHKNGFVRGLICRLCNGRLLTAAKDSPEILRKAADYLENPPAGHPVPGAKAPQPKPAPRRRAPRRR